MSLFGHTLQEKLLGSSPPLITYLVLFLYLVGTFEHFRYLKHQNIN